MRLDKLKYLYRAARLLGSPDEAVKLTRKAQTNNDTQF